MAAMGAATSARSPAQRPTIDFVSILVLLLTVDPTLAAYHVSMTSKTAPASSSADPSANIGYCERDCRAWMTSCLQPGDSCGKCCLTHLHRRPLPGCSLLQNCAKSGPQAARNGRTRGACAPGGGPPAAALRAAFRGAALRAAAFRTAALRAAALRCAFAPELASVRMTATAKAILTMAHIPPAVGGGIPAPAAHREPIKEHGPATISQAAICRAERFAIVDLAALKASALGLDRRR